MNAAQARCLEGAEIEAVPAQSCPPIQAPLAANRHVLYAAPPDPLELDVDAPDDDLMPALVKAGPAVGCPACGDKVAVWLGPLGSVTWLRCRGCSQVYEAPVRPPTTPEETQP